MNRIVYVSRNYKSTRHGGGKARVDVEDILSDMGAVNIGMERTFHSNPVVDFFRNLCGIVKFMFTVKSDDVLVLQYPVKKYYRLLCRWARLRGAKTVTLIHDLGSFRRRKLTVKEEIAKLSLTDVIIAANSNMAAWLRDNGCKVPITEQKVWDYLSDSRPSGNVSPAMSCMFVGNLRQAINGFVYSLPEGVEVHLYGSGAVDSVGENVVCHGFATPDEIISSGEGRFGLSWYGTSLLPGSDGYVGEYVRYNNPHKLALYIRAGKPVVIWSGAGEASFVEEQGIGITVDSLENLDSRLAAITDEEYAAMRANVERVARQMSEGYYIRQAVERAIGP